MRRRTFYNQELCDIEAPERPRLAHVACPMLQAVDCIGLGEPKGELKLPLNVEAKGWGSLWIHRRLSHGAPCSLEQSALGPCDTEVVHY